jgi:hypothetical protein
MKYAPKTRLWWDELPTSDDSEASGDSFTVHEAPDTPQPTGLLDAQGNPLFRVPEKHPIGFHAR